MSPHFFGSIQQSGDVTAGEHRGLVVEGTVLRGHADGLPAEVVSRLLKPITEPTVCLQGVADARKALGGLLRGLDAGQSLKRMEGCD